MKRKREVSKKCQTCMYWQGTYHGGEKFCNYSLIEKKLRDCPPDECNKYVRKEKRKTRVGR